MRAVGSNEPVITSYAQAPTRRPRLAGPDSHGQRRWCELCVPRTRAEGRHPRIIRQKVELSWRTVTS